MQTPSSDRVRRWGASLVSGITTLPATSDVTSDDEHLDEAIRWLYRSQDVTPNGGSAATYNLLLGWEPSYPETTGYIIPTLFEFSSVHNGTAPRERARRMADWLLDTQLDSGAFTSGTGAAGDPNAFNTAQVVLGLHRAYEETGGERYRKAVRKACDWLVETQSSRGDWAAYDYKNETHAYSSRIAWPLLVGADIIEDDSYRYEEAARRNFEWVLTNQRQNGWFANAAFESGEIPFLHTIAYTIRGLIEGGRLLGDERFIESGKATADRLLSIQAEEGVLKGAYDSNWEPTWYYCLTGNAQMAVIWLLLFEITGEREYLRAARLEVQFLKRHQQLDGPPAIRGGIPGSFPFFGRYLWLRYPNWAAKFFADALLRIRRIEDHHRSEQLGSEVASRGRSDPLRVCVLVDGEHVFRWVAESITQMLDQTETEISLVVINEDSGMFSRGNVLRGKKYPAYAAYWIASDLMGRFGESPRYDDNVHISAIDEMAEAEWIRTYPANVQGLWNELPTEVVAEIRETSDVVFRRGFGLIRGDILTATDYGVLSYHHGDPRKYRGGPAGFWEFMNGESRAGAMVQTLRDELDAGVVQSYKEIDIRECDSWEEIRQRLYTQSTGLLADAIETIQDDSADPMLVDELGPIHNPPSATQLLKFLLKSR